MWQRTALLAALPEIAPEADAQSGTATALQEALHHFRESRAALTERARELEDRRDALTRASLEGQPVFRLRRLAAHYLVARLDLEAAERAVLDAERGIALAVVAPGEPG